MGDAAVAFLASKCQPQLERRYHRLTARSRSPGVPARQQAHRCAAAPADARPSRPQPARTAGVPRTRVKVAPAGRWPANTPTSGANYRPPARSSTTSASSTWQLEPAATCSRSSICPGTYNCTCSTSSALTYVKQQRNQQNVTHSSDVRTIYVGYSMMMHHLGRHSTDRVIAGAGDATGVDTGRSVELSLCVLVRSTFTSYLTGPAL
jgi:hypothetical protein